jgi:hypothetical protein
MLAKLATFARWIEDVALRRRKPIALAWLAMLAVGYALGGTIGTILLIVAQPATLLVLLALPRQPFLSRDRH